MRLVISDQHAGLLTALRRCPQDAAHQRCRAHFARNDLATVHKFLQEMADAAFRMVFAYANRSQIEAQYDQVGSMLADRFGKAPAPMAEAKEELLAFSSFPRERSRQL